MKKLVACLAAISLAAAQVPARADDTAVPAPQPSPVISPLNKAQPAPFTGVLLSPEAVAQIVAEKDSTLARIGLAVQHQAEIDADQLTLQTQTLQTTCNADKTVLQAQLTDAQKQNQLLMQQLQKNTGGPGAPVWIGLGFAGGVVVTTLVVFAVSRATK